MAGGIFTEQNKVLPGVYINVKSQPQVQSSIGTRGTVAIAKALSWGAPGAVVSITPGEDLMPLIGYDISAPEALFLREMMRGTDVTDGPVKILLYRKAGASGVKAAATIGNLTATALYEGVRGNDITVSVTADPDNPGSFEVQTVVGGQVMDTQTVTAISGLVANAWVVFGGTGTLTASAGVTLTGGVDPTVSASDDAAFLTAIEPYTFDVIAYDGATGSVQLSYAEFARRMNESIGKRCQLVTADLSQALDSKYCIVAANGVNLEDGTAITAQTAVWWLAGAEAGAQYNEDLTYAQYPTAVSANPKLTYAQQEAAIEAGHVAFIDDFDVVKVLEDVNSKTTVTEAEGAEFKSNRVMRVIMQFCNDAYRYYSNFVLGKVDNTPDGRSLLRGWLIGYLNDMQGNNGIQNFVADDVTVEPGAQPDGVLINAAIQPVMSVKKIYINATVNATGVTVSVS